jgi:hypothetical protein
MFSRGCCLISSAKSLKAKRVLAEARRLSLIVNLLGYQQAGAANGALVIVAHQVGGLCQHD